MGPISCPETSMRNQPTLHNNPEDGRVLSIYLIFWTPSAAPQCDAPACHFGGYGVFDFFFFFLGGGIIFMGFCVQDNVYLYNGLLYLLFSEITAQGG
jgi:hypothetical protein